LICSSPALTTSGILDAKSDSQRGWFWIRFAISNEYLA
jgi:hypothetical protein